MNLGMDFPSIKVDERSNTNTINYTVLNGTNTLDIESINKKNDFRLKNLYENDISFKKNLNRIDETDEEMKKLDKLLENYF